MKNKTVTKVLTMIASGVLIAGTLLVSSVNGGNTEIKTVREKSAAKSGSFAYSREISVKNMNYDSLLTKNSGHSQAATPAGEPSATSATASPTTAPSASKAASTTTAVRTTASTSAPSTTRKTTTTTAKIPTDESKNIQYIKDPDYKSPYYIVVYTGSQSAVVYGKDESGAYNRIIKAFTVSTGRHNVSPTRKGVYKIRAKYRWRKLMGDCYGQYSSSISPDYLFHSVPYARRSPDSLYNASYNNLGRAVSHGCIRMCVRDCKWIFDNCPIGTQVHVVWKSGPKGAGVPRRKSDSRYSGWDPSDQWASGNPYFNGVSTTESKPVPTVKTTKTTTTTTSTTTAASTATKKSSVTGSSASSSASSSKSTRTSTQKTSASDSDSTASTTQPDTSSEVAVG